MLVKMKSAGVTPEVNQGIHNALARKYASEGSILALKPKADVARSPK